MCKCPWPCCREARGIWVASFDTILTTLAEDADISTVIGGLNDDGIDRPS